MAELVSKFNIGCVIQYYSDQWALRLKGICQYIFLIGLLLRTVEITLKSVVEFLVACLVSQILCKEISCPPSRIFKKSMTSQPG